MKISGADYLNWCCFVRERCVIS